MTELTPPLVLSSDEAMVLLTLGDVTVEGRITTASNATLYCRISDGDHVAACVYKPVSGERELWDYPDGTLAEREFAAYLVGQAIGWNVVPPTVLREGPLGTGMVQLWIADDESFDVIGAINSGANRTLQRIAVFDAVVNNSDRKVSHLLGLPTTTPLPVPTPLPTTTPLPVPTPLPTTTRLPVPTPLPTTTRLPVPTPLPVPTSVPMPAPGDVRHIYGIDHGVSFSVEDKLRTVLWQWAGDPIPDDAIECLTGLSEQLSDDLGERLADLLTNAEVRATRRRVTRLLRTGRFPLPPTDWPAVPYPPY
ncbi:MAG TPA: SCO1664 family protein [Jatrophihabitans sp.]|jgi:hypothetical protein